MIKSCHFLTIMKLIPKITMLRQHHQIIDNPLILKINRISQDGVEQEKISILLCSIDHRMLSKARRLINKVKKDKNSLNLKVNCQVIGKCRIQLSLNLIYNLKMKLSSKCQRLRNLQVIIAQEMNSQGLKCEDLWINIRRYPFKNQQENRKNTFNIGSETQILYITGWKFLI